MRRHIKALAGLLILASCGAARGQNVRVVVQPVVPGAQVGAVGAQFAAPSMQAPSLSLSQSQALPSTLALPLPNPGLLSASMDPQQQAAHPAAQAAAARVAAPAASPAVAQQQAAPASLQPAAPAAQAVAAGPVRTLQSSAALEPAGYHGRNRPAFVQPDSARQARREGQDARPTASQNAQDARQVAGNQQQGRVAQGISALYDGADLRVGQLPQTPVSAAGAAVGAQQQGRLEAAPEARARYLAEADGRVGTQLLEALHNITGRGIRVSDYKEASRYMFSVVDNVIEKGVRGVRDVYSGVFVPGTGESGDSYKERGDSDGDGYYGHGGMNVEHSWPQSFFGKSQPMRSDLHHLMPAFEHSNSERSNYPFGEVADRDAVYRTGGGAKLSRDNVFEPPDAVKGRIARNLLYFYMRYYNRSIFQMGDMDRFWNSRVEMFLRWNRDFPPTAEERRRNDLVEKYQGNRNPFVDDPALADKIGAEAFRARTARPVVARSEARGYDQSGRQQGRPSYDNERQGRRGKQPRPDKRGKQHKHWNKYANVR